MTIYVHRIGIPSNLISVAKTHTPYPFTKSVGGWVLPMVVEEVHRQGLAFRIVIFYDNEEGQKTV